MSNVHNLAAKAEKDGIIERPDSCESCQEEKKLVRHHRDYNRPLDITWLCVPCHTTEHMANKELKDPDGPKYRESSKKKRGKIAALLAIAKAKWQF